MMSDVPGTAAGVFVGMATVAALICIYFSIAPQRVEPKEAQRVLAALLCPHILIAVSLIVAVLLVFQRTADQTKIDELAGLSETNQTAAKKEFLDNNLAMFAIMLGQKLDQRCDDNGVINGNGLVKCGTKSDIRFWKDNSYLHVGNLRSDQSVQSGCVSGLPLPIGPTSAPSIIFRALIGSTSSRSLVPTGIYSQYRP